MAAHDFVAMVVYELSEDAVADLVVASARHDLPVGNLVHLDHENRRGISVGCIRCGMEVPGVLPGSDCPEAEPLSFVDFRSLLPGQVVAVYRGDETSPFLESAVEVVGKHPAMAGVRLVGPPAVVLLEQAIESERLRFVVVEDPT